MFELALVTTDIAALIFPLAILIYVTGEETMYPGRKKESFLFLLGATIVFTVFNIITILLAGRSAVFTFLSWSASIVLTQLLATIYMMYILTALKHDSQLSLNLKPINIFGAALVIFSVLLVAANAKTRLFFSISADGMPEFSLSYSLFSLLLMSETVITAIVLFQERDALQPQIRRVMTYLPFVVILLLFFQIIWPVMRMTTIIFSLLLFFYFINLTTSSLLMDETTQLGNRKMMQSSLSYYFRRREEFSVIKVQFSSFDTIEKYYSDDTVKAILKEVSGRLRTAAGIRQAFRIDDGTFILIGPPPSKKECRTSCKSIVSALKESVSAGSFNGRLASRILLVPCPVSASSPEEVMKVLNYFSFARYDFASMNDGLYSWTGDEISLTVCDLRLMEIINTNNHIAVALQNAEFEVEFQPVYDTQGNFIRKAECLVRLYDPKIGLYLSPAKFIPVAEAEGSIDDILLFVVRKSCELIRDCAAKNIEPCVISLNFSARQLNNYSIADKVISLIDSFNIDASFLKIEITESSVIENYDEACRIMRIFQDRGVGVYLDDFGEGYASAHRFLSLPFDCIKIDKSLFAKALSDSRTDIFLKAVIPAFIKSGSKVIIEGVENGRQFDYARSFSPELELQGYFFSPPMKADDFRTFLGL